MFDFRYHAISLAAVLLALVVGLLLGVAIGDRGLVSNAEEDLRSSLRADVREAQEEAEDLRTELERRDEFESAAYPYVVGERLAGRRVGLLALGGLPDERVSDVREALRDTGAELANVAVVRAPLDLEALARRADGTRYEDLAGADDGLVGRFGERTGVQYTQGGKLLDRVRRSLLDPFSGELDGVEGVVLVNGAPKLDGDEADAYEAFVDGLIAGMKRNDVPVVGVEATSTEPSQAGWFRDRRLTSVDNVDETAGKVALVLALGGAQGSFGVKATAGSLLPRATP